MGALYQGYEPAVRQGDKRIILADGEPVGVVNQVPVAGEVRSNMHVGGRPEKCTLSARDREICAAIEAKPRLIFAGVPGVLAHDGGGDEQERGDPQQIRPTLTDLGLLDQRNQRLVQRQQPECRGEGQEKDVAAARPEPREEQPAHEEPRGDHAGQKHLDCRNAHRASQMKP